MKLFGFLQELTFKWGRASSLNSNEMLRDQIHMWQKFAGVQSQPNNYLPHPAIWVVNHVH